MRSALPLATEGTQEICVTFSKTLYIKINCVKSMKFFKNIPAEKIGNFILTVITAFVSTFLMQSCMTI